MHKYFCYARYSVLAKKKMHLLFTCNHTIIHHAVKCELWTMKTRVCVRSWLFLNWSCLMCVGIWKTFINEFFTFIFHLWFVNLNFPLLFLLFFFFFHSCTAHILWHGPSCAWNNILDAIMLDVWIKSWNKSSYFNFISK